MRSVRVIDNEWIDLPDGVRLAARIWLPEDAETRPASAILDWVPYRKSDGTAVGDSAWGTYFARHGFAFVRIDLRGSGDSTGVMSDEYTEQEQDDAERAIEWIAQRPWCTGSVGMIGVSWGGFAALQLAARAPAALGGVVAIHASDDRYSDDVHYIGGTVSAMDMPQWATSMLAYLNQPPDPAVAGGGWREQWHRRLEGASRFLEPWLGHQRRDDYWRQGSACERYDAIRCPVFAVGGWSDGYRDMVLRVVEHVSAPVRGLIGPWGHTSPERGAPGPAIGFLQEVVRFFAASLDGAANGFLEEPRLISYLQEPVAPAGSYRERLGRWVADPAWPSPAVAERALMLGHDRLHDESAAAPPATARSIRGLQTTGIDGGVWCGDGSPADFGLDQRPDDGASLCWDTTPLSERVELLGRCEARLRVSVDRPHAVIVARVCDVAPDGRSTLVARGVLNLSRRDGRDRTVPMPVSEPVDIRVAMQSIGYAIPAGHRIRLAVTNAYWPLVWPSPDAAVLTVHCGAASVLSLPYRGSSPLDAELAPFGPPESGTALETETTMLRDGGRTVSRDLANGETTVTFDWHPSRVRLVDTDTEMGEENVSTYRIVEGEPLSATVVCRAMVTLSRPGLNTRVEASTTMTCDRERYLVTTTLDAFDDGVRVHARAWTDRFERDGT
jgi:putative CocE/NonD family hydrolase